MSNYADHTLESSPAITDYVVGYRTAVNGGERRTLLSAVRTLYKGYYDTIYAGITHTHAQSEITSLVSDLALKSPLASPAFIGVPTAPTASFGTNSTQLATCAFVIANAGGGTTGSNSQDTAAGDGSTTVFTLSAAPANSKALVFVGTVIQRPTTDYSISGTTLTFTSAPANLATILVFFSAPAGGGGSGTVTTLSVTTANGVSGSVATATTTPAITITLGAITPTSVNGITLSGSSTPTLAVSGTSSISGVNTGDQTTVTGNAGSATVLQTARTINGVSFNGSANITVTADASTLSGSSLASGVTASSLTSVAANCTDGTFQLGWKIIPQNSKSAAYTTVLSDSGKHILHPSADTTARTFTIDSNANVAYLIGTAITFVNQHSAGVVTIAITSDTLRLAGAGTTGSRSLAADGVATAIKVTSTEWIISGTGLT